MTGAASGIGFGIASALAQAGVKVMLCDIEEAVLTSALEKLKATNADEKAEEEGTLATLKTYRDAMGGLIEAHGGRVVNTWGDGLFVVMADAALAARCAQKLQAALRDLTECRRLLDAALAEKV